ERKVKSGADADLEHATVPKRNDLGALAHDRLVAHREIEKPREYVARVQAHRGTHVCARGVWQGEASSAGGRQLKGLGMRRSLPPPGGHPHGDSKISRYSRTIRDPGRYRGGRLRHRRAARL